MRHKRRLIAYFGLAFILSMAAAIETTLLNKEKHTLAMRESAHGASHTVNDTMDSYKNLLSNLLIIEKTAENFNKSRMDSYYKGWLEKNEEKSEDIVYYGYNNFKEPEKSFFSYTKITPDPKIGSMDVAKILSEGTSGKDLIPLQVPTDNNDGTLFIVLDVLKLEKHLSAIVNNVVRELDINLADPLQPNDTFENKVIYDHDFQMGKQRIHFHYIPSQEWKNFSFDNVTALFIFLAVFIACLFLITGFLKTRKKVEISEQAKDDAEQKYREQNVFLNQILENIPGILFIKDVQNEYRYYLINKAAEKFFGYTAEELLGCSDRDFFSEEESNFFRAADESTMAGGKVINIPCELITTKTGEMMLHTRKFPIYDENGQPKFLIGLSEDITKRKQTEMELAGYRENLERMVDERTEKLKAAILKSEEANRLKSEFLATMSHEIRSPMSGVLGMAELLLDTPLTSQQKDLTKTILNSGEVLMNIIEDILDFSKIEANKLELDPIAVNMLELVDDVSMLYSTKARDKALELAVRYVPGSEQFVYADPMRIRQVLGNLINNAIKFTETGFVIITVHEDFDAVLPADKVKLVFSIEDSGIGIAEKDRHKIFEKFSQVNSSDTRNFGGTGLGLSICRKLIEMMGGEITLRSETGKGSTFEFYLSMTRNQQEIFIQPRPPVLKDLRILVVDDLAVMRDMLCEQLGNAGMICEASASGAEALNKLIESRDNGSVYDMIIIDYLMPGMNGEMLARAINDEPDFRNICLIMLTAAGSPIVGDDYAEKGFSAYLSKPVNSLRLIDTLAIVWQQYNAGYTDTLIRVDTQGMTGYKKDEQQLKLDGSKILLVEDSRLNQAFAEEVLSQLACHVTTVSNGQEALDALLKDQFDLVLMDCQMPVMDGFEAANQIRIMKENGIIPASLPIIALTANAMKGDKQRCLEAGMDDYISKPVRKKELKEKIYSWLGHKTLDASRDGRSQTTNPTEEFQNAMIILDHEILSEARLILKDKFDFMLDCYIEDVESYIGEIQEAALMHDVQGLVRPAHTIKSTSKRMGALQLSDIARQIEISALEAANSNQQGVWEMSPMMDYIRSIAVVFEETRNSLMRIRVQN